MKAFIRTICIILLIVGDVSVGYSQESSTDQKDTATGAVPAKWQHLETLVNTIDSTRKQLAERRSEWRQSEDERERKRLSQEIDQLSMDLESLQTAWEMMATGGADLDMFGVRTESAFNWRDELQSVFEPILVELRHLTERPRKIERLRNDQAYYQQRLDVAEEALASIEDYRSSAPLPHLKAAFDRLEERWRTRRDDLQNRLNLVDFELQETLSPTRSKRDPVEALKQLLSGRVLNLVIAVVVMALVYLLLRLLSRGYERIVMRKARVRSAFVARAGNLLIYFSTGIIVLISGMAVFYVRGDWLLLGLVLIMLAGAAFVLQKSLPNYLQEARIMLNLGPIREGERISFNGVPWRIKALSLYATLVNPMLQGGTLRVPVRELLGYQSRGFDNSEPWFPARVGDYVILDDNTYGKVIAQTPETVQMLVLGAIKHFRAGEFIGHAPRNLTAQGFTLTIPFGLDYQHQADIVDGIPGALEKALKNGLAASDVGKHLTSLAVEFAQAGASSLDLLIIAAFSGEAADSYFKIQRLLQRLAVEACNANGWVIPFNQITVHRAAE